MMKYEVLIWKHDFEDEPVVIYSELDGKRFEVRKVEVFKDGKFNWSTGDSGTGNCRLGVYSIPPLEEVNSNSKFESNEIPQDEFEVIWEKALKKSK